MIRTLRVALLLGVLWLPVSVATGQSATPAATPAADRPLDLAAMLLTPADLEAVGLTGFGSRGQEYRDRDAGAVDFLIEIGWLRDYGSSHAVSIDPGGRSDLPRTIVTSYVAEYTDPAAAAAGFAVLEEDAPFGEADPAPRDLEGSRAFGDQSDVTRYESTTPTGRPFIHLDLAFQRGNLFGGVAISEYSGAEPDLATLEALADELLAKIEAVVAAGGPGLQQRALRLADDDLLTRFDGYTRLRGETIPSYRELAEETAATAARMGDATDSYAVSQRLTRGTDDEADDVLVASIVTRFATPAAASDWLRGAEERLATVSTNNEVVALVDVSAQGDESAAFSFTSVRGGGTFNGLAFYVRIGGDVAGIRLESQTPASLEAAAELAQAQGECLSSVEGCSRLPVSSTRLAAAVPATPVGGTPVS